MTDLSKIKGTPLLIVKELCFAAGPTSTGDLSARLFISRQTILRHLDSLVESGIVQQIGDHNASKYLLAEELANHVRRLAKSDERGEAVVKDAVRATLRDAFKAQLNEQVCSDWRELKKNGRPDWIFDIQSIIHPAYCADENLHITWASPALIELAEPHIPNIKELIESKEFPAIDLDDLHGPSLLRILPIYKYDLSENRLDDSRHALDAGIVDAFVERGVVNQFLVRIESPDGSGRLTDREYISISLVPQSSFLGVQSIMPLVTRNVETHQRSRRQRINWQAMRHHGAQPLAAMGLFHDDLTDQIDTLETKDELKAELRRCQKTVGRLLTRFQGFFKSLTDLDATFASEDESLESIEVPVIECLKQAHSHVKSYVASTAIEEPWELPSDKIREVIVEGSYFRLWECFFNIIQNALTHGVHESQEPRLFIRVIIDDEALGAACRIEIEDSGRGLNEERQSRLNQMASQPASRDASGMYSGMEVVAAVVAEMGGSVSWTRGHLDGCLVSIELPVARILTRTENA